MIPKVIYYCWFGGEENQPDKIKECIKSWNRVFPDYDIIKIDENYLDFDNPYIKSKFENKEYAFLADYVRLQVLKDNPGIYLDTDMFFVKPFTDDMLDSRLLFGCEDTVHISLGVIGVSSKNDKLITDFLEYYDEYSKVNTRKQKSNVALLREVLKSSNINFTKMPNRQSMMDLDGVKIYSIEYFYPISYNKHRKSHITDNTFAVHLWTGSAATKSFAIGVKESFLRHKEELEEFLSKNNSLEYWKKFND